MKAHLFHTCSAAALLIAAAPAVAQTTDPTSSASAGQNAANNGSNATSDNSVADSGNDNSTNTDNSVTDSGNDNSTDVSIADSGNDNSTNTTNNFTDTSSRTAVASADSVFGDNAIVASGSLSSYVTGVSVSFDARRGSAPAADNSLRTGGSSFQNFAGMQALNQNTGVGASQNASVSVAVSTGDVNP